MKRFLLVALILGVLSPAQHLLAQARKIVLFEHFTNASCGPCANQNPIFDQNIRSKNKGNYIHVAYHTVWPGRDPMNAYNKEDVAARVSYYGVNGVPDMVMQGNMYQGSPSGATQDLLDLASGQSSPLRIRVHESSNGTQRTVHATLTSVGLVPTANLRVRALVIESEISYASPPGTNGEKEFPNVFRRFLTTPEGDAFTPAAVGESIELRWTYDLDATTWDTTRISAVVFAQLDGSKEVINAGTSTLPDIELVSEDALFKKGMPQQSTTFSARILNFGIADVQVRLRLSGVQPPDWNATLAVNGTPVASESDVTIPAGGEVPLLITVNVGDKPGIAEGMLSMASLDDPELTPQKLPTGVISRVTDLVVNNDNAWGADNGTTAADFSEMYMEGLTQAGSTTHAAVPLSTFMRAFNEHMLDDVDHVYYNAGWAFPALPDDFARAMMGFMGEGANLLVAGQDVGWDVFDPAGHGTSTSRAFYRAYLFANFTNDGDSLRTNARFVDGDPLFGGLGYATLTNAYGRNPADGKPFFYPDQIRPTPEGVGIAFYNDDPTTIAAVRGAKNDYKSVYTGFGLEMIADVSLRNAFITLTWQWFHDVISEVEFDAAVAALHIGQNYPNPVGASTVIPFTPAMHERALRVHDMTGRLVLTRVVPAGSAQLHLETSALRPGTYSYQIFDGPTLVGGRVMQVLR